MANLKISELSTSSTISTGDYLPCIEGGLTKKVQAGTTGGLDVDTVDGIHGLSMWYSSSGTGGSDGNGGQPPAPKPRIYSAYGIGECYHIASSDGVALSTPNPVGGSTWLVTFSSHQSVGTGGYFAHSGGAYNIVLSGNTQIVPGIAGYTGKADVWRIA